MKVENERKLAEWSDEFLQQEIDFCKQSIMSKNRMMANESLHKKIGTTPEGISDYLDNTIVPRLKRMEQEQLNRQ